MDSARGKGLGFGLMRYISLLIAFVLSLAVQVNPTSAAEADDAFSQSEILDKARGFFGETTEGLAKAIEHVFAEKERPDAAITGEEFSGAFGVGLRYGKGDLQRKNQASREIFWQGPSVGFDIVLAPIRTGVGLKAGANIGYLHYSKKHSWIPL